jgi:hypothetical protein
MQKAKRTSRYRSMIARRWRFWARPVPQGPEALLRLPQEFIYFQRVAAGKHTLGTELNREKAGKYKRVGWDHQALHRQPAVASGLMEAISNARLRAPWWRLTDAQVPSRSRLTEILIYCRAPGWVPGNQLQQAI